MRAVIFVLTVIILALPAAAAAQSGGGLLPAGSIPAGSHLLEPGQTYTLSYPARAGYELWIVSINGCIGGPGPNWQTPTARPMPVSLTVLNWSGLRLCPVDVFYVPTALCRGPGCPDVAPVDAVASTAGGLPAGATLAGELGRVLSADITQWILAITVGGLLAVQVIRSLWLALAPILPADEAAAIQEEAELYEHLKSYGIDRDSASDIAGAWRDRNLDA